MHHEETEQVRAYGASNLQSDTIPSQAGRGHSDAQRLEPSVSDSRRTPEVPLPSIRPIPSSEVSQVILSLLALTPSDRVLEIGTGSGTQTKLLAATGAEVYSIEIEPWTELADHTGGRVYLKIGDGQFGFADHAPYSAIVATCGVEQIPKAWVEQLAEGGRLVVPIGDSKCQRVTLFVKSQGELVPMRVGAYCRFMMLKQPKAGKVPYRSPDAVG